MRNLTVILHLVNEWLWDDYAQRYPEHWLTQIDRLVDLSEVERVCAAYHVGSRRGNGVNHTIRQLVRRLVVKYMTASSYRQTEELVDSHMFIKVWVGYSLLEAPLTTARCNGLIAG